MEKSMILLYGIWLAKNYQRFIKHIDIVPFHHTRMPLGVLLHLKINIRMSPRQQSLYKPVVSQRRLLNLQQKEKRKN